ncbi:restriction endonuclease subunit S [Succinispira mobilis]|uniref:restriction endonuclease subunit S n=1 Tax=Succinispira mobilis TaxID=78120 RepID=UPI0003711976|nr:restriction endonuclease subunit S [Succinispira mobilis]
MSEWKKCKLGDYAKVLGGYAFKSADFKETADYPVIKIKNIASGKIDMSSCQYITNEIAIRASNYEAKTKDILIAMTGSHITQPSSMVGRVTRYSLEHKAYINQRVGKIVSTDSENLDEDFLFYHMIQDDTVFSLANIASGSANQANISATQIEEVVIDLPDLPEQQAVAEVLSSLDDKIDLLSRQNKTLEDLAQTYFRQWFVESNNNDNIFVSDLAKLNNVSVNPSKKPLEPFYHYSLPSFDDGHTPAIELGQAILSNKYIVQPNTILISKLNPIKPRIWRIGETVASNSVCSTEFQVLNPFDMKHYLFLYCLMKSYDVVQSFAMSASGTSGSHQRIRPEYITEVETPAPDERLLDKFNDVFTPVMGKVDKNQAEIITLQKLRDTLLPKLISGEVRIKM